ncbi:MAG: tetratricopeptide repeat protein [Alphaproteobacteria bacterium]|nr:tetratricopeptide repeat protein [Alphaproteobacteria bacterium]
MVSGVAAQAGGLTDADAGITRLNAGDSTAAIALFTRAIQSKELTPEGLALTYYHRGMAFYREGQSGRAILDYATALWNEDLPREFRPRTLNNRGLAFEAISDFDSALTDYSLAIKMSPNYADAFANRGNVHRRFNRFDIAIIDYDSALRNGHPRPQFVFAWQGMALEGQGKRREAMEAFRRALAIDPNFALAKSRLDRLEETQQMSNVLGRRKVAKGPVTPLVLSATPGTSPVAAAEGNVQLTPWTPAPPVPDAALTPVAQSATPARNPVSLRPAFDDQPKQVAPSTPIVSSAAAPKAVAAAPVQPPVQQQRSKPRIVTIEPSRETPQVPVSATGEGGSDVAFAIQLGSFKSRDQAEVGWNKALRVAGDLLNGLSHVIETVPVEDGVAHRLFAEALPDRQAALGLCRTLRDKGTTCIVVRR